MSVIQWYGLVGDDDKIDDEVMYWVKEYGFEAFMKLTKLIYNKLKNYFVGLITIYIWLFCGGTSIDLFIFVYLF